MGPALPAGWQDRLAGYNVVANATGRSGAGVLRLSAPGEPALFLKREACGPFAELPGEIDRLRWLAAQAIPVPAIVATADGERFHHLLTSALPGENLADAKLPPAAKVALAAVALRQLHGLPVTACPFDAGIAATIALAEARLNAGLVDEADFDADNLGRAGADVLARLKATVPAAVDPVVTHGDATFANMIADNAAFAGFVDCGRLGVADRYRDLAIMARDIASELGGQYLAPFFAAYGIAETDEKRLAFYRLTDEFF